MYLNCSVIEYNLGFSFGLAFRNDLVEYSEAYIFYTLLSCLEHWRRELIFRLNCLLSCQQQIWTFLGPSDFSFVLCQLFLAYGHWYYAQWKLTSILHILTSACMFCAYICNTLCFLPSLIYFSVIQKVIFQLLALELPVEWGGWVLHCSLRNYLMFQQRAFTFWFHFFL